MSWFNRIGKRKKQSETITDQEAVAFVNFDYWNYSLQKLCRLKPDINEWKKSIDENLHIKKIYFFVDFSVDRIQLDKEHIYEIADEVVDTQDATFFHKRNMTDVIMMNRIYQFFIEFPEIKNYIIFAGSGQFQFPVEYLRYRCNKRVILYGVKDAISTWLKGAATEIIEIPAQKEAVTKIYDLIIEDLSYVSDKKYIVPTFRGTVKAVASQYEVPENLVHAAMAEMIKKGLIYKVEQRMRTGKTINAIKANWKALERAGMWPLKETVKEEADNRNMNS